MVNFYKLQGLINEYKNKSEVSKIGFFQKLYDLAKSEVSLRQTNVGEWF